MLNTTKKKTPIPKTKVTVIKDLFKKKEVYVIEGRVWEQLIRDMYNVTEYYLQSDQLTPDDTTHEFTVGTYSWNSGLDDYDNERLTEWEENNGMTEYVTGLLLERMYENKQIPAGTYLIQEI